LFQLPKVAFRRFRRPARGLVAIGFIVSLGSCAVISSLAQAGTVSHGNFMGASVVYAGVTESSSTDNVPLFGTPVTLGDTLSFFHPGPHPNPSLGFGANAPPSDTTDGFLSFGVMAKPGYGITALNIAEGGDYSMSVLGAALAKVTANLIVSELAITQVDGAPINPVVIANSIDGVSFELPGDPAVGLWDLAAGFNIGQMLTDAGVSFNLGATKLTVKLDNTLQALAAPAAAANIVKKQFDVKVKTNFDPHSVPEPATCLLAVLGLSMMLAGRSSKI